MRGAGEWGGANTISVALDTPRWPRAEGSGTRSSHIGRREPARPLGSSCPHPVLLTWAGWGAWLPEVFSLGG